MSPLDFLFTYHAKFLDLVNVKLWVVAKTRVRLVAHLLRAVDLPLLLVGQAQHGGFVGCRQVQLLLRRVIQI